ncbi:MAG: hydrogenase nickel incorporation protein HypB [candidate division Zixibacteria bacterium]|nr:hydrogenase nickel incorporation protein HypB [candidate division Zixibacteria bacterium]
MTKVQLEKNVLSENDRVAADIRRQMTDHRILCLNLVSSPGSGKTSLLEKTLAALGGDLRMGLVAGDVQTENDADRLKAAGGAWVRPIVTGGACHLDARMVQKALSDAPFEKLDLMFIENVGNLVCPSSYDLGEDMKVVLISTTEGDDKPSKYPGMFRRSSLMIVNKTDLMAYTDFSRDKVRDNALAINGRLDILELSCRSGDGLDGWYDWLRDRVRAKKA